MTEVVSSKRNDAAAIAPVEPWLETSSQEVLAHEPLVSVLMIVYNQDDFLAQAIESIVTQRCQFMFELIIGDDVSMDGSLQVALEYQRRYPRVIRVLHGGRNLGMTENSRRVRAAARGPFLAWCEGDDYWCDPDKLEAQASVLRERGDVGAVHTDWARSRQRSGVWEVDWAHTAHRRVPTSLLEGELLENFHNPLILRTCTLMLRKEIAEKEEDSCLGRKEYGCGDAVTALFITSSWKVAYLPMVSAVYRVSEGSVLRSGVPARIRFMKSSLEFDADARIYMQSDPRYPEAFRWELLVGLALWSLRARDFLSFMQAARAMASDFSVPGFFAAAARTIWMRRKRLIPRRSVVVPDIAR